MAGRRVSQAHRLLVAAVAFAALSGMLSLSASADLGAQFRLPFVGSARVTQGGWGHDGILPSVFALDFAPSSGSLTVVAAADGTLLATDQAPTTSLFRPGTCPSSGGCIQLEGPVYCQWSAFAGQPAAPNGGYGRLVKIQHAATGLVSYYAHLASIAPELMDGTHIRAGAPVKAGAVLGVAGNSGCSEGVHLHFEVKQGSTSVAVCDLQGATWGSACQSVAPATSSLAERIESGTGTPPLAPDTAVVPPADREIADQITSFIATAVQHFANAVTQATVEWLETAAAELARQIGDALQQALNGWR